MPADVSQYIDISALIKILLIGLVAGAGLTAVFSLGVVGLSRWGYGDDETAVRNPAGMVMAVVCFLIVLAGIGYGISVALTR